MAIQRLWDTQKGDIPASYTGVKHLWSTAIGDVPSANIAAGNPTPVVAFDTYLGEVNGATGLPTV